MLFWLLILGLIIFLLARSGHSNNETPTTILSTEARLAQRNQEWAAFIAAYKKVVKTKAEKALVDRMLQDIHTQGLVATAWDMTEQDDELATETTGAETAAPAVSPAHVSAPVQSISSDEPILDLKPKVELDNVSLLLYFGAFLFVASVGLFIAFGGANGAVRTFAVLAVTAVLYGGGIWLFRTRPKLEQAGVAFSGIGMTIAPLTGVAAYYYLFSQSDAPGVWFVTSLLCFGMYFHALWVFRRPLVSYILIFTFLSLFESGVSIMQAPIYYFGWAMAMVGIILSAASQLKGFWPEVQESSRTSSQVILPLSILTSLVLVPQHGAGQLGVSLLFAAAYYGLEALKTKDLEQQNNAIAAHIATLASVVCLAYASTHSWHTVAIVVLLVNLVQMLSLLLFPQKGMLWRNFASVMLGMSIVGILLAWLSPGILLAAAGTLSVMGFLVWRRQARLEGYVLSVVAWVALPLIFGQYYLNQTLTTSSQAMLMFSSLLIQLCVYMWYGSSQHTVDDPSWKPTAQQLYIVSSAGVLVASLFAPAWACFALSLGVVATLILLAEQEKDQDWSSVAGVMVIVPIFRAIGVPGAIVAAHLTALLLNIVLALCYRREIHRWLSTGLWLGLPWSLGAGLLGDWTAVWYAWSYVAVMAVLVFSRTVARGGAWVSSKVPLASFAKSASTSYVAGYIAAASTAVVIALFADNPQLHATLILALVMGMVYYLARWVEKRADVMALLPLLAQAILWSAIRPISGTGSMTLYLLASTCLAAGGYFAWQATSKANSESAVKVQEGSLIALFVVPAAIFVVPKLMWPMPFGLFIASLLVYHHIRNTNQQNRELAGGLIVAAILWFMWYAGIREVQAYTHVIVALFALYAYWRALRKETEQSDQYLMCMLATATVPLALQALSGQAGGLYGWWLLLEQIAFMLIGMTIGKRLVTLWGLYVAVGAVLYQLRNLGWAALSVLAIFLIGIAVYQLQRHDKRD